MPVRQPCSTSPASKWHFASSPHACTTNNGAALDVSYDAADLERETRRDWLAMTLAGHGSSKAVMY